MKKKKKNMYYYVVRGDEVLRTDYWGFLPIPNRRQQ